MINGQFYKGNTIHSNLTNRCDWFQEFLLEQKRDKTQVYTLLTPELADLLFIILTEDRSREFFGSSTILTPDQLYLQMKGRRQDLLSRLQDVFENADQWQCRVLLGKDEAAGDLQVLVQIPLDAREKIKKQNLVFKNFFAPSEDSVDIDTKDRVLHLTLRREPDRFVITSALLESNISEEKFEQDPSLIDFLSNTVAKSNMPSDRTTLEISQWLMNQSVYMIYLNLMKMYEREINSPIKKRNDAETLIRKKNKNPEENTRLSTLFGDIRKIESDETRKAMLVCIPKHIFASAACLDIRDRSLISCRESYSNRWADKILVPEKSRQQLMNEPLLWFQNGDVFRQEKEVTVYLYHGSGTKSVVCQRPSGEQINVNSCRIAVITHYYAQSPRETQFFPRFQVYFDFIYESPVNVENDSKPVIDSGDPFSGCSLQESVVEDYKNATKNKKKDIIREKKAKGLKELNFYTIDDLLRKTEHENINSKYWPVFGSIHEVSKDQAEESYRDTQLVVKVGSTLEKCDETQAQIQKEQQEAHDALLDNVKEELETILDKESKTYIDQGKSYTKTGWFVTAPAQWKKNFVPHNIKSIKHIESQLWDNEGTKRHGTKRHGTKRHIYYVVTENPVAHWSYQIYFLLGKLQKFLDVGQTKTFLFIMDEDWEGTLNAVSIYPVKQDN